MPSDLHLTPAQQAAGVDRIGENIALISGAGCGKTFVLARRFVELLQSDRLGDRGLSGLVAVTFTRKAAMEMAQRVRKMLTELATDAQGPRKQQILTWLEQLPEARIGTIHSFCSSILRNHALAAGLDPDFSVHSDDMLTARLRLEAADKAVLSAVEAQRTDVADLLSHVSFPVLVEQVETLVDNRCRVDLEAFTAGREIFDRWREQIERNRQLAGEKLRSDKTLGLMVEQLRRFAGFDPSDKLARLLDFQLSLLETLIADPASRVPQTFEGLRDKPGRFGSAKVWGSSETVKQVRDLLKDTCAKALEYADAFEQPGPAEARNADALAAVVRLAVQADKLYTQAKRRRGILDFADLLYRTGRLLQDRPDVARTVADGIDQLLIDECQDTDAFQVQLLETLARRGAKAMPPGRLFIVGDPKQSIYRFRGTQLEVFDELVCRFGRQRTETLNRSFRSHRNAVEFVNHVFSRSMGPDYTPLEAHRQDVPPHSCVEILLAEGPDGPVENSQEARKAQATVLAQRIRQMVQQRQPLVWDPQAGQFRPVRYRDIAILFSRMTVSLEYEQALAAESVPYYVIAGSGFLNRQEILDLLNALQAIDNPHDDVALMGLLRSALVGLDDNALMRIALAADPPYGPALADPAVTETLAEQLCEYDFAILTGWLGLLRRLQGRKDALRIDQLIQEVLDFAQGESVYLTDFHGKQALGNIRRMQEMARAASLDGLSLADFVQQVRDSQVANDRFEQAPVSSENDDVVRLVTIHKAKGLEFPVVCLPDLNRCPQNSVAKLLIRRDWQLTYDMGLTDEKGTAICPLPHRLAAAAEKADAEAEDLRQLYVAITRMKDHLVLVGANQRNKDGQFKSGSYLHQLDKLLGLTDALEDGCGEIHFGDGPGAAAEVRTVGATPPARSTGRTSRGEGILSRADSPAGVRDAIVASAQPGPAPAAVGPVETGAGSCRIAVTALNDFALCPRLFHYRYELSLPPVASRGPVAAPAGPVAGLNPLQLGTLLHRCLELYDPHAPRGAAQLLAAAVEGQADLPTDLREVRCLLDEVLDMARTSGLFETIASARQVLRELDFVNRLGPGLLRGQIDLLFQTPGRLWQILDYKSDRIQPGQGAEHGRKYQLQLAVYAQAASRFLGEPIGRTGLYFMRTGEYVWFDCSGSQQAEAIDRAEGLIEQIMACRRDGFGGPAEAGRCAGCPYGPMCPDLS
ncbi:MAG: UvrD-helicase domain-containing protein [Planctomycetota bacterium]